MLSIQRKALWLMGQRNVGAVWTAAFGWVWRVDVRTHPDFARAVVAQFGVR